jgi:GNAT superfamily N-acetyltransferase
LNATSTLIFRLATDADIPAMAAIRLAVTENRLRDPGRITVAMYRDYLDGVGRSWVCEDDGVIAGFASADREQGSIWALFIDPAREGQGIGKRLLALAVEDLFEQGHEQIVLSTSADTRADIFYESQGWERGKMKDDIEVQYSLQRVRALPSPDQNLYEASVPVFQRYLRQLRAMLAQGEAHPQGAALLEARLAPGMLTLAAQAEVAANFAVRACAPLAGSALSDSGAFPASALRDSGSFAPTYAGLGQRIDFVLGFLEALTPAQFDGAASRMVSDRAGDALVTLPGQPFLLQYALPNFFFHLTMAYAILRQHGFAIGKADFDGFHVYSGA